MSHHEEPDLTRDIAIRLVLPSRGTHGKKQENIPRETNFKEHLEVQDAEHPRVELRTHEEVVDRVPRHAMLRAASQRREVRNERNQNARKDGDTKQRSEFIDDGVQLENTREMEGQCQRNSGVE